MKDIVLRGGLDLINAKPIVAPGFLEDCQNYEVGIEPGYQVSGGFERFDGHISPSNRDVWDMTIDNASIEPGLNKTIDALNSAQTPTGIHFSQDGTLMFLIGSGDDKIYRQYLSEPWNLDAASAANPPFPLDVTTVDTTPQSITFTSDGRYVLVLGDANNRIYSFRLYTEYLPNSSFTDLVNLSVASQETSPKGICLSPNNEEVYVCGSQVGKVHQYTMPNEYVGGPPNFFGEYEVFDISLATHTASLDVSLYTTNPAGVAFTADGYTFYVADAAGVIHYFSCATAWMVATATWFKSYDTGDTIADIYLTPNNGRLFVIREDGGNYYVDDYGVGFEPNEVIEWSSISFDGNGVPIRSNETGAFGVVVSQSVAETETTIRFAYWDSENRLSPKTMVYGENGAQFVFGLESLTYQQKNLDASAQTTAPTGCWFKPDGTKCYVTQEDTLFEYNLSIPWDASTGTYSGNSLVYIGLFGLVRSIAFTSDGLKLIACGDQTTIYDLSTAWDITSTGSAVVYAYEGNGVTLGLSDFALYVVGTKENDVAPTTVIYQIGWLADIDPQPVTTMYIEELAQGRYEETGPTGITFNDDGTKFYLTYEHLQEVHEFICTDPWDVSTAQQSGSVFWADEVQSTDISASDIHLVGNRAYLTDSVTEMVYQFSLYPYPELEALAASATDIEDYQDQLADAADVFRDAITPVPGSGPVLGQKWYKEQLYAVRDYYHFNFRNATGSPLKVGQHVIISSNDSDINISSDEGIIREIIIEGGSFADDDGYGSILIEPLTNSFSWENRLGDGLENNRLSGLAEIYFVSGSAEPSIGDEMETATTTETFFVYRAEVRSGAWADGDAAGIIYAYAVGASGGVMINSENVNNATTVAANVMTLDINPVIYPAGLGSGSAVGLARNLTYHSFNNDGASMAGLYRSSRTGWEKIPLGWEVRFVAGESEPSPIRFGADTTSATVVTTGWAVATSEHVGGDWVASAGTVLDAIAASGGAYVTALQHSGILTIQEAEVSLAVGGFNFELPAGARVVGIEIEITAQNTEAATDAAALINIQPFVYDSDNPHKELDGIIYKRQALGDLTASLVAYTFGGENDLWGAVIDRDMVMDPNFGIKVSQEFEFGTFEDNQRIDLVRMRVHYVEQGQKIYFYDTVAMADYADARLVNFHVETGDFDSDDAAGIMHIYDLTKPQIPTKNIEIRTAAAGAGTLIADASGNERLVYLPGSKLVNAANSKYEMVSENIYARDDLEGIYGVNGAGPAFCYDSYYFRVIRTGLSPDLDKPRHLALFQFRLWLGYGFGEGAVSVAGDPLSFDGELNAVATGYGRPITGFARLAGKTLGVFTDRSVDAVTVSTAWASDFDQSTISPESGAREYTIKNVSAQAMYADQSGVSTPQVTERYGDFEAGRMSALVHPWLLPRVQTRELPEARDRVDVVAASACRGKNQYRLYFADGYRMTFTLRGPDTPPEITKQFLYIDGDESRYVRVLATESEVGADGRERLFFSMDKAPDYDNREAMGYCYEEDSGLSYDGGAYKRWFETSPLSGQDIHTNQDWDLLHLFGASHGYSPLKMTSAIDLAHPADADDTNEDNRYRWALGKATNEVSSVTRQSYFDKDRLTRRGRHIALRFQSESDRELPHLLQLIGLDVTPLREER